MNIRLKYLRSHIGVQVGAREYGVFSDFGNQQEGRRGIYGLIAVRSTKQI